MHKSPRPYTLILANISAPLSPLPTPAPRRAAPQTPSRLVELAPSSLLEPLRRNILNARAGRDAAGPTEGSAESRDPFDMLMMRVTADPGGRAALHHLLATEGEGRWAAPRRVATLRRAAFV